MISIVLGSIINAYGNTFHLSGNNLSNVLAIIVPVCFLIASLVSGSLADTSVGKYKIIKGGFVLDFISAVIYCIGVLAADADALVMTTNSKLIFDCVSLVYLAMLALWLLVFQWVWSSCPMFLLRVSAALSHAIS